MLAVRPALVDEHGEREPLRLTDDVAGELGEVRHVQLGHHEGDDARPALSQVAPGQVHPVAEMVDGLADDAPGPVGDMDVVVDHVGHRLLRHPRVPCDVLDPGPCHAHLPGLERCRVYVPVRPRWTEAPGQVPARPSGLRPAVLPELFTANVHRCKKGGRTVSASAAHPPAVCGGPARAGGPPPIRHERPAVERSAMSSSSHPREVPAVPGPGQLPASGAADCCVTARQVRARCSPRVP